MLKRVKIQGYKSLVDVELELQPLTVLFGPNAVGKSNMLDALQLLSRIATSRNLNDAFQPPYRGHPLESFTFGPEGIGSLLQQESAKCSLEIDVELSSETIELANQHAQEGIKKHVYKPLQEKQIRYRIEIEIRPASGKLWVADEEVSQFTEDGVRTFGYGNRGDHSLFSGPYARVPQPQIIALQAELESWRFFYFEPRERMRQSYPVKEVLQPGAMGDDLGAFLNTLKANNARQFQTIEKALSMLIPPITGIDVRVNNVGEIELSILEGDTPIPARLVSEGTLRVLGLLAVGSMTPSPGLIGFEEPENGVHPRRIRPVAEFFNSRAVTGRTQFIVTTHSPIFPDFVLKESLYECRKKGRQTVIEPCVSGKYAGTLDEEDGGLPISERILRGDFDA